MTEETTAPESKPRDRRALNAYRHGLTGQVHIVTPAEQVAYEKHCRGIHESFAPVGAMETGLVQSIADDRWRLNRAVAIENAIFAIGIGGPPEVTAHHPEIDAAFAQATVWLSEGKNLQLLGLYEHRMQRRVEKNIQMLHEMQRERKAALQQALEQARLLTQLAQSKGEVYDPKRDFPPDALPPQFDFSHAAIVSLAAHHRRLAEAQKQFSAAPKPLRRAA